MPKVETKDQQFKKLVEKRVTRAVRSLRLVADLASRRRFKADVHADKIMAALRDGVRKVEERFTNPAEVKDGFTLD